MEVDDFDWDDEIDLDESTADIQSKNAIEELEEVGSDHVGGSPDKAATGRDAGSGNGGHKRHGWQAALGRRQRTAGRGARVFRNIPGA